MQNHLYNYLLQLADNSLILGHRLSEWCGHGPILETDIALTNIALDLTGQARMFYQYAAEVEGKNRSEDDLAYLRIANEYKNALLVELPNENFAYTIVRQFLYDAYCKPFYEKLQHSTDKSIAAIAEKALKEVTYHLRFSSEWMIRLGDGTEESHRKMQIALDDYWMFAGELLIMNDVEQKLLSDGISVDLSSLKSSYLQKVNEILERATLTLPSSSWMQKGGKQGIHTEHLGFILADMQYMQKTYPGLEW